MISAHALCEISALLDKPCVLVGRLLANVHIVHDVIVVHVYK